MRASLILLSLIITSVCFAQKPKVKVAAKADTSLLIKNVEADTPRVRWKNNVVENHFNYGADTLQKDSIEPKRMKAIKRKEGKQNKRK